ncbi:hypothetical protein SAMN02910436_02817 [Ruminococcaceae bacterium P7]|nr:hypothetical protein SAMN02910436_02817 [Ruminococcaceae bacterium P7]
MKKTTIKRTTAITSGLAVCALIAVLCFTGCGNNSSKTETTTAPTTVAVTTAEQTTIPATSVQESADDQNSGSTQNSAAADKQESQANQQKAAFKACEAAANLYGKGNWGVASIETKTTDAGTEMYYIGVMNYSDSQSKTYYFYVDGENCSPDNSANDQTSSSVNQEENANKMKAVQSAVEKAKELYGESSWHVSSCEQQTSSDGSAVYYIGVTNSTDSQGTTHYFYADGSTCTPADN